MKRLLHLSAILIFLSMLMNCATVRKQINSKNLFIKKENAKFKSKKSLSKFVIKENKKGQNWAELTSPFIHWSKIKGTVTEEPSGDIAFLIESMRFITNWPNGWTRGEIEATGSILFKTTNDGWTAKVTEEFETWEIIKGEVRYFDDYYIEQEGLKKVKARIARIKAINDFIKQNEFPEFFGHIWFKTTYGDPFNKTIKNFLFNKKTEYPEHLVKLKESGTVKRDLEEAVGLMFMDYNLQYYFNNILNNSNFIVIE